MADSVHLTNGDAISFNAVLGPIVLSICINAFFYGFSVLQFIQYRTRLFRDNALTQMLVSWTFLIDSVHTGALCWMLWYFIVDNFADPTTFFHEPWPLAATPIFVAVTAGPIELYFAYRVWDLSGSRVLFWIVVILTVITCGMAVVSTAYAQSRANVNYYTSLLPVIDTWLGSHVVCDGVTSTILLYYSARSRTGFRRYDTLKNKIAQAFIQSSLLTCLFTLADLILFSVLPTSNYHLLLGIPMGRVYTCTLIAMLNVQLKRREDEANGITSSKRHSYENRADFAKAFGNMKRAPTEVQVGVSVREEVEIVDLPVTDDTFRSRTSSKTRDADTPDMEPSHDMDCKVVPV